MPGSLELENHFAAVIYFSVVEEGPSATLRVLCFVKKTEFRKKWSLPGGSGKRLETALETARREATEELAKYFMKQESFLIYFDTEPVKIISVQGDGGKGIHRKYFFHATSITGQLREEEISEPDGEGKETLGVPQYVELRELIKNFEWEENHSQLRGLRAALKRVCDKDLNVSRKIAEKYADLLPEEEIEA